MHRAELILEAVAAAIRTQVQASGVKVYTHRRLSLADDQDELPAFSVDFGEDTAVDDGASYMDGGIDSLLTVNVTAVVVAPLEEDARRSLLHLRGQAHIAINKVPTLGLLFVSGILYGGANPPELNVAGEMAIGELTSPWGVRYEMDRTTPE